PATTAIAHPPVPTGAWSSITTGTAATPVAQRAAAHAVVPHAAARAVAPLPAADPGAAAIAMGLGHADVDGSVVFAPASGPDFAPATVQRAGAREAEGAAAPDSPPEVAGGAIAPAAG